MPQSSGLLLEDVCLLDIARQKQFQQAGRHADRREQNLQISSNTSSSRAWTTPT